MSLQTLPFFLVDVFARQPLAGNGLAVFLLEQALPASAMQRITQEMRQFETIFLRRLEGAAARFEARIFTMEEELPFAGHPVIGAAALLHSVLFADRTSVDIEFVLRERSIPTSSRTEGGNWFAEMNQGQPVFGETLPATRHAEFLAALNLTPEDLVPGLAPQVVSTGLPYLVVPLRTGLERARIAGPGFEALLATAGAKFAFVLDVARREIRTWDNDGKVEDIATGSAAGPAAAWLVRHGLAEAGAGIVIAQGRFLNRPSELHAITGTAGVTVSGQVCLTGDGALRLPASLLTAE
jgi:trans-2,3-dihydro-3-hydroxyanthranilate isomerase